MPGTHPTGAPSDVGVARTGSEKSARSARSTYFSCQISPGFGPFSSHEESNLNDWTACCGVARSVVTSDRTAASRGEPFCYGTGASHVQCSACTALHRAIEHSHTPDQLTTNECSWCPIITCDPGKNVPSAFIQKVFLVFQHWSAFAAKGCMTRTIQFF